jgi:hypothetical protein
MHISHAFSQGRKNNVKNDTLGDFKVGYVIIICRLGTCVRSIGSKSET